MHRALADPLRIQLLECLWAVPQTAKQLAAAARLPPDRLYYHLAQLEQARLIEVAEYRRLPGGKVERVYRPSSVEPPGDAATPREYAEFLGAMLEATRADVSAASVAREAGQRREIMLIRAAVRLSEAELVALRDHLGDVVRRAREKPEDDGTWTRVVVALVDLQDRGPVAERGDSQ
jgi:DNA-binding transcriptional ArsR family regulator